METIIIALLLTSIVCQGAVHFRHTREVAKQRGEEELLYKNEPGYDAFLKQAKAIARGEWMNKDIVLAKYWKHFGQDAIEKVKQASDWQAVRKDIPFNIFQDISQEMEVDISHKDKEGRVVLYQQVGKPNYVGNSKDSKKRENWLGAFDQIIQEAASKQIKRWEDKKSEFTAVTLLYNYEGFDKEVYLCPACVSFAKDVAEHSEIFFPQMFHRFFLVNTPPEFKLFWDLVSIMQSQDSRARVSVFGKGKEEWLPEVTRVIDTEVVNKLIK